MDQPRLSPEAFRLIAGLRFDPGYLLLCDFLQSKVDSLTDELADPAISDLDVPAKLRYWQALRSLLSDLRSEPESFAQTIAGEPKTKEEDIEGSPWALLNPLK